MIDPDKFRRLLSHFPTGVTVVTTCERDGRPAGLTVSSFASVSLEPPLVLVCIGHKSQSYAALMECRQFAVNILAADQDVLSRRFASMDADKFAGVPYRTSALGLPLLDGALAELECTTVSTHVEGDHTILVGRVEAGGTRPGEPLVYCRGAYRTLAPDRP